jgi:epsilon-lactone hydrolase
MIYYIATYVMATYLALLFVGSPVTARSQGLPSRNLPARTIPTPTTTSPEMQKAIAEPPWDMSETSTPKTNDQWKAIARRANEGVERELAGMLRQFHATVETVTIAGVRTYRVTPDSIAEDNRGRLLVHLHGGAYLMFGGEAALPEAILMAHYGKIEVISIDYRMPPDYPFPAALDDSVSVWKELIKSHPARSVGLFGTSAGGGLVLATVLKLKELGVPLPGAIMAGTPWADLSKTGDTYFTNQSVDNVLCTYNGDLPAEARLYAGAHDLKEPLLSPVYGDFRGFPPTILISGTRDLFLSNTVRVHQRLLDAGVPAELLVFEGQSHGQYLIVTDSPESASAFKEVSLFFERNLTS